jgi:NADH:ubiquinone oxidoreductase subunit 4 (subunit M)
MFTGIFKSGVFGSSTVLVIAILAVTAIVLTISYTFLAAKKIFFGPLNPDLENKKIKDPPLIMIVPLLFLAVVLISLGLYPKFLLELFHSVIGLL